MVMEVEFVDFRKIALNPDNPRIDIHNLDLQESLKEYGLQQPIIIRPAEKADDGDIPKGCEYVVIDGDCRLDSFRQFPPDDPLLEVGRDVIIRNLTREKAFIITIQANFMRKEFTLKEEVGLVNDLRKRGHSVRQIKDICKKSIGWVDNRLKIMKLDDETVIKLYNKEITLSQVFEKSVRQRTPEPSSLAGKLVQARVVRETIAIEGPEEKPITKPPKISCSTEFFEDLKDAFPNVKFIDVKPAGGFTAFNIETDNEGTLERINKIIENLHQEVQEKVEAKKSRPAKQVGPKENRTTYFTQEQFAAIKPQLTEHEYQSHQIIGDHVNVLWRNDQFHYNAIQWILSNKDKFPLDEFQLKQYTDLKPVEIEEVLEREVSDSEPCFIDVSKKEYDSFTEEIKYLISKEEKQKGGSRRVWFRTWVDNQRAFNWLKPSQEWETCLLDFPAKTFKSNNLQDVLVEIKDPFPVLYQELRNLQKLTKKISPISNTTIMEIISTTGRLRIPHNNFVDQLLLIKRRRRIDNGREEHKKICDKCLQPKWMTPQQILCGNCEYQERQQKKKSAAATSSGGRA